MSNGRRKPRRGYYGRQPNRKQKGAGIGPIKPIIFIIVVCFSLTMRFATSGPLYEFRESITTLISKNVDLSEAIETIGKTFSGKEKEGSGENAILVFGKMILGIEDEDADEPIKDETSRNLDLTEPQSHSITMAGDISGLTFDVPESPMPEMDMDVSLLSGFIEDEDYDDTPNEAFEIPSPDIVDDSVYKMNFKTVKPTSNYRFASDFGYRIHPISGNTSFHYGVDLAASSGTTVVSIADGTVIETGYGAINGNYIKVSHADGFVTHYAHLKNISVKKGAKVAVGQKIGTVGSTGYSTGPHLHFEVRRNGFVLNPNDYFAF